MDKRKVIGDIAQLQYSLASLDTEIKKENMDLAKVNDWNMMVNQGEDALKYSMKEFLDSIE